MNQNVCDCSWFWASLSPDTEICTVYLSDRRGWSLSLSSETVPSYEPLSHMLLFTWKSPRLLAYPQHRGSAFDDEFIYHDASYLYDHKDKSWVLDKVWAFFCFAKMTISAAKPLKCTVAHLFNYYDSDSHNVE
jgi:hypothetical protein